MFDFHSKHPELSDEQVLAMFRESGDLDTLGELYARYIHLVYGVSLKYLGSSDDAQDAVMHIFEKLLVEIPKHQIAHFRSWLYVLTKNHCFMELRAGKSTDRRLEALKNDPTFMESGEDVHPIDEEEVSMEDALKACIGKLKEEQKRCIELFYYEKLCYKQISSLLKISEKKVKSFLQNGKRNLKICLENKDER